MQINPKILKSDESAAYVLRSLYRRFGYCQYKMSKFEEYSLYAENKDFLVSNAIISFTDTKGRLLALKPDVTLSIVNNIKDVEGHVHKLYYDENVYRMTKNSHTYREIKQTGLECIGDIDLSDICEVILLALRSLENLSEKYIFEISHLGILESTLQRLDLSNAVKKQILRCISSKNMDDFLLTCREANLPESTQRTLSFFIRNYNSFEEAIYALREITYGEESKKALSQFCQILDFITEMGYADHTRINYSLTTDMNYYNGVAFKGYIQSIPTGILSGGQYDNLMKKMKKQSKAIGFAVYLDELSRLTKDDKAYDVDIVLIHDGNMAAAVKEAEKLSAEGFSVRLCHDLPKDLRYGQVLNIVDKRRHKREWK